MTKIYHLDRLLPNSNFRDGDEKIIENIIKATKSESIIDIHNIAQTNYTFQSSISRLSRKAGFNNFREFVFFLSNEFLHKSINQLEALLFVVVDQDWDLTDSYLNDAFSSKKIYLSDEGFYQTLANYTYRELLSKKTHTIDLEGVEIGLVSDRTPYTLIAFSQSGKSRNKLLKMEECKKHGGKVIASTATENSSYTVKNDLLFIVESGSTSVDYENQNLNYFPGNCLDLVEYLISHYTEVLKA